MISHKIKSSGADQGYCMIDSNWGTVCLLENSNGSSMDTYRMSVNEWKDIVSDGTGNAIISNVKSSDGLKDPIYSEAVEWMDAYFCTRGVESFECTAF